MAGIMQCMDRISPKDVKGDTRLQHREWDPSMNPPSVQATSYDYTSQSGRTVGEHTPHRGNRRAPTPGPGDRGTSALQMADLTGQGVIVVV